MINATLIYARRGSDILMLERAQRPGDPHSGKWNGLGGKLEPEETPLDGAIREFEEESGIRLKSGDLKAAGTILFPKFKDHQDWLVWIFTAELSPTQIPNPECPEGRLTFVHTSEVLKQNLWDGDKLFLAHVLGGQNTVNGVIWYRDGRVTKSWLAPSPI